MAKLNLDNERNRGLTEPNRVPCLTAEVEVHKQRNLCRVERGHGRYGGYRKDILIVNLTERDALLICEKCEGIMREACLSNSGKQFCSCCRREIYKSTKSLSLPRKSIVEHSNTLQTPPVQKPLILPKIVEHSNTRQTPPVQKPLILPKIVRHSDTLQTPPVQKPLILPKIVRHSNTLQTPPVQKPLILPKIVEHSNTRQTPPPPKNRKAFRYSSNPSCPKTSHPPKNRKAFKYSSNPSCPKTSHFEPKHTR